MSMTNWLFIRSGTVVGVITQNTTPTSADFNETYDTLAEDDSQRFKVGDTYDVDVLLNYNTQLWIAKGWLPDPNTPPPTEVKVNGVSYFLRSNTSNTSNTV